MVKFYHRFLPHASEILAPLVSFSSGPKTLKLNWTEDLTSRFSEIQKKISDCPTLMFYDPSLQLQLTCDASDIAIGAALHQKRGQILEPIEFFSRKLSDTETRYSAFDRELLAIHDAVSHFSHFLSGRQFEILTDHKPLVHLIQMKNPSPRQHRQILYLSQFDFVVSHLPGKQNVVADFLSRNPVSAISLLPDSALELLQSENLSKEELADFPNHYTDTDGITYDSLDLGVRRIIVPTGLRMRIFETFHKLHHPGRKATFELIHTRFVWPNIRRDIQTWCQECTDCQKQKVTRHIKPPVIRFPTGNRFEIVHLDIVGPLPPSNGCSYILTMIDRKTRWPEAVPISSISAENVARHFINTWIARYGVPSQVITDQGRQFESNLFQALAKRLGFKHVHTTSYHPQSNGLVERFHRTLKTSLRCLGTSSNWHDSLPLVLLGWRNTFHSSTGTSPSVMLFGAGTAFPDELFRETINTDLEALHAARKHFLSSDTNPSFGNSAQKLTHLPSSVLSAKYVWIREKDTHHMKPRYTGPFPVISIKGNVAKIKIQDAEQTINLERLKPAFGFSQDENHPELRSSPRGLCGDVIPHHIQ